MSGEEEKKKKNEIHKKKKLQWVNQIQENSNADEQ